MEEHQKRMITSVTPPIAPKLGGLRWLRQRLLPGGASILMVAAYVMILVALISFILLRPSDIELPAWRFYGTILALAAMLALQMVLLDFEARFDPSNAHWFHLLASGALFLLANWLGRFAPFFPYLIFMLTAQAFVNLRFRYALVYTIVIACGWLGLLWLWQGSLELVIFNAVTVGSGIVFSTIFSLVIVGYSEQTARAEALLSELQAANVALSAARDREKDLAVAEERVRLARDIHDGLGHHLAVLNVQLQAAAKLVRRDPDCAEDTIEICREEAQAALDEVRHSVAAMRRTPLDSRSLDEALRILVDDFDRHSPLDAQFVQRGAAAPLAPAAAMTLYRTAQEGLTNAQKHAQAQHVTVTLDFTPSTVRLAVQDDGRGFVAEGTASGFGLAGLRERAELLGGVFTAAPQPNGGFQLEVALPITPFAAASGA